MRNIIINLLSLLSFTCFGYASAAEYKATIWPVNMVGIECELKALNDKGVSISTYKDSSTYSKICIFDAENGLKVIDSKGQSIHPISINNAGQILGRSYKTFIWSKSLGFRWLEIFNSEYNEGIDINDLGQVIGTYRPSNSDISEPHRPFLWDFGSATDMGPGSDFCKQLETLGYYVMNIELTSINNRGEIAGHFSYGKFNEKKKTFVTLGREIFFWNGDMHILPLSIQNYNYPQIIKVNNKGVMLVQLNNSTYLWDLDGGLQLIPDFHGKTLNDSSVILGIFHKPSARIHKPAIWKDGIITTLAELLKIEDVNKMAPIYSNNYDIEKLTNFVNINNKDQIGCSGIIWNEIYPCILKPTSAYSDH